MTETELQELQAVERIAQLRQALLGELRKVIVGQTEIIEQLLIALLAKGHCLLIGVPGLAKTLLVSTLARVLDLTFKRIQFTPDLMPSDILGTDVLQEDPETGRRRFEFLPGPIFAHIILADEINRAPPKTQSALLEAMQERKVTVSGRTYDLPQPFFVLATQNPIEMEGTYPLPEAQLDRFLFSLVLDYPVGGRRRSHRPFDDFRLRTRFASRDGAGRFAAGARVGAQSARARTGGQVCRPIGSGDPTEGGGSPRIRPPMGAMGRGTKGIASPHLGRQGAGAFARAHRRQR